APGRTLMWAAEPLRALAVSPGDRWCVVREGDRLVVFDRASWEVAGEIVIGTRGFVSFAINQGGDAVSILLPSTDPDGVSSVLAVYTLPDGREVSRRVIDAAAMSRFAVARDGGTLYLGDPRGVVAVDARSGGVL